MSVEMMEFVAVVSDFSMKKMVIDVEADIAANPDTLNPPLAL